MPFLNGGVNDARLLFALSPCRYERGCIPTEMTLDCGVSRRSGLRNLLLFKDAEDGTETEPATVAERGREDAPARGGVDMTGAPFGTKRPPEVGIEVSDIAA